jgi:hypothetical protein
MNIIPTPIEIIIVSVTIGLETISFDKNSIEFIDLKLTFGDI